MEEKKVTTRSFEDTVMDENGNLHAVVGPDMPTGKQTVKRRKFADTVVDENGNLHAIPDPNDDWHKDKEKPVHHTAFDGEEKDENGNIHLIPKPDFAKE